MPGTEKINPSKIPTDEAASSAPAILEQMERILNSPEFNATDAQRSFLQYVIKKKLDGLESEIKGYTVATEVFGRGEDFDQTTDPVPANEELWPFLVMLGLILVCIEWWIYNGKVRI